MPSETPKGSDSRQSDSASDNSEPVTDLGEIDELLEAEEEAEFQSDPSFPEREQPLGFPTYPSYKDVPGVDFMHELPADYEPVVGSKFDKRTSIVHWHPRLEQLSVPTIETTILELESEAEDEIPMCDIEAAQEAINNLGGEAFVRTMYSSAKQDIRAGSYLPSDNPDGIRHTVAELVVQQTMGRMATGDAIAIREWLDLDFVEYSHHTLHPEVRFFIEDGSIKYYYPRVSRDAFIKAGGKNLWEKMLRRIENDLPQLIEWAGEIAGEFTDPYSVDFLMDTSGDWHCSDMALDGIYYSPRKADWKSISAHQPFNRFNLDECHFPGLPDVEPEDITRDMLAELGR